MSIAFSFDTVFDTFPWPQFEDVVGTRSAASPISPHDADPSTNDAWPTDDSRVWEEKKNIRDAVERVPATMIQTVLKGELRSSL